MFDRKLAFIPILMILTALVSASYFFPGNHRLDRNLKQQVDTLGVESLVFISNGQQLATTNQEGNVDLWDIKTGNHFARFDAGLYMVRALLHGENDAILGGDRDGVVWIWGISKRRERIGQSPVGHINSGGIALSSDKKVLFWPGDNLSVIATDLQTKKTIATFDDAFGDEAAWRYISATGNFLATASGSHSDKKQVNLYNIKENNLALSLDAYGPVAISADQTFVACLSDDRNVGVFEIPSGKERFRTDLSKSYFILSLAASPNNKWVAIGAGDNHARILDAKTGVERFAFEHDDMVDSVAFSPDSKLLATGSRSGFVRVFELETGKIVAGHGVGE